MGRVFVWGFPEARLLYLYIYIYYILFTHTYIIMLYVCTCVFFFVLDGFGRYGRTDCVVQSGEEWRRRRRRRGREFLIVLGRRWKSHLHRRRRRRRAWNWHSRRPVDLGAQSTTRQSPRIVCTRAALVVDSPILGSRGLCATIKTERRLYLLCA